MRICYELNKKEHDIIMRFLKSEISSRSAGKILKRSHTSVINLAGTMCRQWFTDGLLKIDEKLLEGKETTK